MTANQDSLKLYFKSFPPGYRFIPTDEELIEFYLKDKILKRPLPPNKIKDVDIYQYSLEELHDIYQEPGEEEMYFFTPRNRKYPKGSRPNRSVAEKGFWKASGGDKPVGNKDNPIGFNRSLVYYHGGTNKGSSQKTDWLMHEYTFNHKMITASTRSGAPQNDDMKLDDWVLCKVYKRKTKAQEDSAPASFTSSSAKADEMWAEIEQVYKRKTKAQEDSAAASFTSSSARADEMWAEIERLYAEIELEPPNIPDSDAMYSYASSQMLQDAVSRPHSELHHVMSLGCNTQSTVPTMPTMPYFDASSLGSSFENTISTPESNEDSLVQNKVQEYSSDSIWLTDEETAMVSDCNEPNYQAYCDGFSLLNQDKDFEFDFPMPEDRS